MHTLPWEVAATLLIGGAFVVGCDKNEEKTVAPAQPSAVDNAKNSVSNMADSAKQSATNAETAVKDAANKTADKASDLKDSAMNKAADTKDATMDKATEAKDNLAATAQKYYDQASGYLATNNLTSASGVIDKLEAIKAQLSPEWQKKIDGLKSMYDSAKAKVSHMVPATQP
jgi:hypothetical protein